MSFHFNISGDVNEDLKKKEKYKLVSTFVVDFVIKQIIK